MLRILRDETELLTSRAPLAAPRALAAAEAAMRWLATADDAVADAWFADNMDLDSSRAERLRRRDAALAGAGLEVSVLQELRPEDARVLTPAQLRWEIPARREGAPGVRVDVLLDPRRDALVQSIDVLRLREA